MNRIIIEIALIAFWFSCVTGLPQRLVLTNRKPFTCPKCMGFWLAFIHQSLSGYTANTAPIIVSASLLAWLLETICIKFKLPINR